MKTYTQQSRKKKKLNYIQLKNRIETDHLFLTHDVFTSDMQWVDIYFFGKNKQIYNATIRTISCSYHDAIHDKAWAKLRATKHPNDKLFEIVELDGYSENSHISGPTTVSNPPLESLKGLTASQFLEQTEIDIAKSGTVSVKEFFKIFPDYVYGIGLDMVIKVDTLNSDNIDQAIKNFIANGEKNWESEESYTPEYTKKSSFTTNAIYLD